MIDQALITVIAGRGGRGTVAFRREKFVPRGGPAGGDGGRGGDVVLVADEGVNTLNAFRYERRFEAGNGVLGGGSNKHGRDGGILEIRVPVGTEVYLAADDGGDQVLLGDLASHGGRLLVASGGRGGRGNARFVTSTLREPLLAEQGEEGEAKTLRLELKLIADIGIVGLPNAGKSSLLRALSAATPKVADYPFTTLEPNLGVVEHHMRTLVAVDIPGLIEGAHEGVGLGHEFLRHVERTRVLVHLVDGSEGEPGQRYRTIRDELARFDDRLAGKPEIVVVNKIDVPEVDILRDEIQEELSRASEARDVLVISALGHLGLEPLKDAMFRMLDAETERAPATPAGESENGIPVLRPVVEQPTLKAVTKTAAGYRIVHPRAIRLANGSDLTHWKAQIQMRDQLKRLGVTEALEELGIKSGDAVALGEWEFTWE